MGRLSFLLWRFAFTPGKGTRVISARATNALATTQTDRLTFNPAGYNNNVLHRIRIEATCGSHYEPPPLSHDPRRIDP